MVKIQARYIVLFVPLFVNFTYYNYNSVIPFFSPVLIKQCALPSIHRIHIVNEEVALSCCYQQPRKFLDPTTAA